MVRRMLWRHVALIALLSLAFAAGRPATRTVAGAPSASPTADPWASLRRPLDLPTLTPGSPCPRTAGRRVTPLFGIAVGAGPVYVAGLGLDAVTNLGDAAEAGGWRFVKVLWFVGPDYAGPILLRGRQLDGPNAVRFEEGVNPLAELRLNEGGPILNAPGWRNWATYTRVRGPGCYAYQVDGVGFREVIVFQVVPGRPADLTPLPPPGSLPHQLMVQSAVATGPDQVRLALAGAQQVAVRIDVGPSAAVPPQAPGPGARRIVTAAGPVLWVPDPTRPGQPQVAVWDDGRHHYRLEVLDAAPGAWSEADLVTTAAAFAQAVPGIGTPTATP